MEYIARIRDDEEVLAERSDYNLADLETWLKGQMGFHYQYCIGELMHHGKVIRVLRQTNHR